MVGIVTLGAGVPGLFYASAHLDDTRTFVGLVRLDRETVTLADALADERDETVVFIAAGRPSQGATDVTGETGADRAHDANSPSADRAETPTTRVDQQIIEISALHIAPADVRRTMSRVPSVRHEAMKGKGSALDAYRSYTALIDQLHTVSERLAAGTPASASPAPGAPAALDRAAQQASATRGLLLAALAVPGSDDSVDPLTGLPVSGTTAEDRSRDDLTAAAQQAHARDQAALADFGQAADAGLRSGLAKEVSGPQIASADHYLDTLADSPELSSSDRSVDKQKVNTALSARIAALRDAESALLADDTRAASKSHSDALATLELVISLLGGCLVIGIGTSVAVARSVTRPLAALRLGAARVAAAPETEEPIRFTGRNDEFAQVVRAVSILHGRTAELAARAAELATDKPGAPPTEDRERRSRDEAALVEERTALQERAAGLEKRLEQLRHTVQDTFVNLSLRNLGLVERQLGIIEALEEREENPERLATLYKLDHLATVMRRHGENLLVLAEHEQSHGTAGPVPLVDVLRAAVSEIERYERITIQTLPSHALVAGFAADDLSHLVAELLENATAYSPPDAPVELSGWLLESGEAMLSVVDQGIGIAPDRLARLNRRLNAVDGTSAADSAQDAPATDASDAEAAAEPATGRRARRRRNAAPDTPEAEGLGLRVIALLARRHGVRVELRKQQQGGGGTTAVVILPKALLPVPAAEMPEAPEPREAAPQRQDEARGAVEPRVLHTGDGRDPLIAAAERAVAAAERAAGASGITTGPRIARRAAARRKDATGSGRAARSGPYAIGPDSHERAEDQPAPTAPGEPATAERLPDQQAPHEAGQVAGHARPAGDEAVPRTTGTGLPKRTPRPVRQATAPRARTRGVDAEELRRRLGGFQQGARNGRRDAETEYAAPDHTEPTGETVEEARS